MSLLNGPGYLLVFGLSYLVVVILTVVAFLAASRGWTRLALVADWVSLLSSANFILLLVAAHEGGMTTLTATPVAATVMIGLPAAILLGRNHVIAAANLSRCQLRGRLVMVGGLLVFLVLLLAAIAATVIFPQRGGLSNRSYPGFTVFVLWIGDLVFLVLALAILALASRTRERTVPVALDLEKPRTPI